MTQRKGFKEGDEYLVAVIGDADTVTGFLLAGVGNVGNKGDVNFLIVDSNTPLTNIENSFKEFTTNKNVGILLITQKIAEEHLRPLLKTYDKVVPVILEIPSKEEKYDPAKDFILQKAKAFLGGTN